MPTSLAQHTDSLLTLSACHVSYLFLQGWQVKVWRDYERFIADLTALFPHEKEGIRALYDEFWKVG